MRDNRLSILQHDLRPPVDNRGARDRLSFAPPSLPFGHLPRKHLTDVIDQPFQAPLTLIVGAPGSGKTTLAAEWAHKASIPVGWYALDAADSHLPRFAAALRMALRSALASDVQVLPLTRQPVEPEERGSAGLLSDIARLDRDACLILDQCEALPDEECISVLSECVMLPGTRLRIILLGRSLPAIRLGRLRALSHIREIGTADLAFSDDEAARVLRAIGPAGLPADVIARIVAAAQGWAAGVVLLGASIPHDNDHVLTDEEIIRLSSRNLDEYVAQEIVATLPDEPREFVLATSGFPWMSAHLCDASLIADDSASKLEALPGQFPFVTQDEGDSHRYRYHPLVRASMWRLAQQSVPERIYRNRNRRAAAWLIESGEFEAAAELALGTEDWSWTAEAIEPLCRLFADRSDFETLERWLARLPAAVLEGSLNLSYWTIAARLGLRRFFGIEALIEALAPRLLAANDPLQTGRLELMRGIVAVSAGNDGEASTALIRARDFLPPDAVVERLQAQTFLGDLAVRLGRDDEAGIAYSGAEACAARLPLDQQWNWHVIAPGRANTYALRGDLNSAITKYRLVLAEIPPYLTDAGIEGLLRSRLISLYIERNDLEAARREAQIIDGLVDERGRAWYREAIVAKARLLLAEGRRDDAEEWASGHLKTLRRLPEKTQLVHLLARIWLERGEYSLVESWLADVGPTEYPWIQTFGDINHRILAITLDLQRERYEETAHLLAHMAAEAAGRHLWYEVILLSVRRAVALRQLGRIEESHEVLRPAIGRGARGGFLRAFFVPGFDTVTMFSEVWSERPEYLPLRRGLVEILGRTSLADSAALSKREIEVLRLVAEGRTNQQIAAMMYISTNTVRNHLVRIGQRLHARNRQEAVTRARELKLLD